MVIDLRRPSLPNYIEMKKKTRMRAKAQRDGCPAVKWMETFTRDMGKVRM